MSEPISILGLDHVALVVRDVAASSAWYQRVLGLKRVHEQAWGDVPVMLASVRGDGSGVALFPLHGESSQMIPDRWCGTTVDHVAFRVDRASFESAQPRLGALGIQFHFEDHVVSHSIYFSDPDGHRLELTTHELHRKGPTT